MALEAGCLELEVAALHSDCYGQAIHLVVMCFSSLSLMSVLHAYVYLVCSGQRRLLGEVGAWGMFNTGEAEYPKQYHYKQC